MRLAGWLVLAGMALMPTLALACPTCAANSDDATSQVGFVISTTVMLFTTFGMVGGLVLWLRRAGVR
ncbi:MAG: hypothetical protein GY913_05635 [Proteobacteria bacterium]|nr:hypothetical protein [Pseudomonadota bacterium]MCP4916385.1 hypothetical protein [Pseudomonadota bacterium]